MNPDQCSIKDFLLDKTFINWVKKQNPKDARFWDDWLLRHPEKIQLVEEAILLLNVLPFIQQERPYREVCASRRLLQQHIRRSQERAAAAKPVASPNTAILKAPIPHE
jgi:hypothetical protein